jgi:hypothetical protein
MLKRILLIGDQVTLAQGYTPFGVPLWRVGSGVTGYGFTGERWEAYAQLLLLCDVAAQRWGIGADGTGPARA